jgi:catechol 2,3-dioxygenase-like lactoylglutathione lyase family enzyme
MEAARVSAVLFVKDLQRVSAFYVLALGMSRTHGDEHHVALDCRGFNVIVHQIPPHLADEIALEQPPRRRAEGALRLSFPVQNIAEARRLARSLGGDVDDAPPAWAEPNANTFLGHDPEGNVFKLSES